MSRAPAPFTSEAEVRAAAKEIMDKPISILDEVEMVLGAAVILARQLLVEGVATDWQEGCPCVQCELVRRVDAAGLL